MPGAKAVAAPMQVAQIPAAGADFQIVDRELPRPGDGQVRIKVEACGICHSDVLTKEGNVARNSVSTHSGT
jgi:D-arabinose 1-dehydrogenase-like Zn-dependent alcohol dehydrogenase